MSARFMLDTDSVSYALRGQGRVGQRIMKHRPSDLCISSITLAELRYGAARRKSARLQGLIDAFISDVVVASFDETSADQFGELAATLAEEGAPIGELDTLIAAHALSLDVTLVTNNVKHFNRISRLKIENWF